MPAGSVEGKCRLRWLRCGLMTGVATRWSVDQVLALAPEVSSERAAGGRAAVLLPRLPAIELLATTLRFRHGMIEELG